MRLPHNVQKEIWFWYVSFYYVLISSKYDNGAGPLFTKGSHLLRWSRHWVLYPTGTHQITRRFSSVLSILLSNRSVISKLDTAISLLCHIITASTFPCPGVSKFSLMTGCGATKSWFRPQKNILLGPQARTNQLKTFTLNHRAWLSVPVTWTWSERVNLYRQQVIKGKNICNTVGPSSGPVSPGDLNQLPPSSWRH